MLNRTYAASAGLLAGCGLIIVSAIHVNAQSRTAITINDTLVYPESLTSSADGSVWFGSTAKGMVYRAAPNAQQAEPWIPAGAGGLQRVLGVFADERARTLWVCSSPSNAPDGPEPAPTAIVAFDIETAAVKSVHPFDGGGRCNDMAVATDGTVYATDIGGGRVMRLQPGAEQFEAWAADDRFAGLDGIAVLGDGSVYVNAIRTGLLFRIPVKADGTSGTIVQLETSAPIGRPDGMRAVAGDTLLVADGAGRLLEAVVQGDRANVRVIKEGLTGTTAVTLVDGVAFVLESKFAYRSDPALAGQDPGVFRAVAVPYAPPR
jgi:sugar lactone lactonase YvrE